MFDQCGEEIQLLMTNLLNMAVRWGEDFIRPPHPVQSAMGSNVEHTAPTGLSS